MTAKEFISTLKIIAQEYPEAIPKREIFSLAREFLQMPVQEVIKLLQDESHDHRIGAVSILDWKARHKKTSNNEKEELFRAYIDNHRWIND